MCGCVRAFCRFAPGRALSPTNSPWATGGPTRSTTTGDASICGSFRPTSRDAGSYGSAISASTSSFANSIRRSLEPWPSPAERNPCATRGCAATRSSSRSILADDSRVSAAPSRATRCRARRDGTGFEPTAGVVASNPSVNHSAKVFFIAATPISIMPLIGPTSSFGRMSITHTKRDLPGPSSNTCATAL